MLFKLVTGIACLAVLAAAIQTYRLQGYQSAKARLETCQKVNAIKEDVNNATDDDLADSITDTD